MSPHQTVHSVLTNMHQLLLRTEHYRSIPPTENDAVRNSHAEVFMELGFASEVQDLL
jgi:hypothetical protein